MRQPTAKSEALAMPSSPLSHEADSPPPPPPPPPPPSSDHGYASDTVPPPPDHPPPHDALPPAAADVAPDDSVTEQCVQEEVDKIVEQVSEPPTRRECVQEVVEEIVNRVADSTVKRERVHRPTHSVSFSETEGVHRANGGITPSRKPQPKQLTVGDVKQMLEKSIAEVESNGKNAATAALQVGMVYWHGPYGIERNQALGAKYLKLGLEKGALDGNAAFQLGMIYNSGAEGWEPDATQAVRWWAVASELGHAVAMFNLGVMKMNGNGCDLDPVGAMQLFAAAHATNPRLKPPSLPHELIAERIATAERLRKERAKRDMSAEEKEERRVAALRDLKIVAYSTGAIAALTAGLFAFRHWWNNTL